MKLKQIILVIAIACIECIASNQLTFSKDTVEFPTSYESDTLVIRNVTDSAISIDTLRYTWTIDRKKQSEAIGVMFDTVNSATGKENGYIAYYIGYVNKKTDTSFSIYTKVENQQIKLMPKKSMILEHFMFGHCIMCAGALPKQASAGIVSIRMVFVNNRSGKDTVIFIGPTSALISSGVIQDADAHFRIARNNPLRDHLFLGSGRKIAISRETNCRTMIPFNLYFTESARVPITIK